MSRYQTLDVSLQFDRRETSKLAKTLQYQPSQNDDENKDEKVKYFRELYFKNQRLRKQLKNLNTRLNDKLEKVKLPNVKKRALSVDLNKQQAPTKAMKRQLQNAYKQIKMYKTQIQTLKIKEESIQGYDRIKNMQNAILYKDKQILNVQEQIKSIKAIKKLQEKVITNEIENEEVKERIEQYKNQSDGLKNKLKEMAKKVRKRESQYKKQQAYQVSLEKKIRGSNFEQKQAIDPIIQKPQRQISSKEWQQTKDQLTKIKYQNDQLLKKIAYAKKNVTKLKQQQDINQKKLKQREAFCKAMQIKIDSLSQFLRQGERQQKEKNKKKQEQKQMQNPKTNANKIQQNEQQDDSFDSESMLTMNKNKSKNSSIKQSQRQWKGKTRKLEHGFMAPGDQRFQIIGKIKGLKVCLDQNQIITGLAGIYIVNGIKQESQIFGNRSNVQLKWQAQDQDELGQITGAFTEQGYLSQIIMISRNGMNVKFGASNTDSFIFKLDKDETIQGIYGSFRELGKDIRITQLGCWITKDRPVIGSQNLSNISPLNRHQQQSSQNESSIQSPYKKSSSNNNSFTIGGGRLSLNK